MLVNMFFHHEGVTTLWQLPTKNYITLEAMLYGLFQGLYFASLLIWIFLLFFHCDSAKIMYLASKIHPKLALFLSMIFKMIPYFKNQFEECLFQCQLRQKSFMNYL